MASARPTVVTRTGALPELIEHERNGLVVSPDEPHEMAAALERFLGDRPLSDSCRLAAYAKAKRQYDTGVVLPRMLEAYESAADFFYGDRDVPTPLKPKRHLQLRTHARALASVA
jgi:glycosyltransferase involved in cell wall biosynthesis